MNGMSPVAPVLEIVFHLLEIMKFHDQRNPDSSCSYLAAVFPSGCLDITELDSCVSASDFSFMMGTSFFLSIIPFLIPCIPDTWSKVVGISTKQFPVQWMYWWWVLKVALDICMCGSVVQGTKPNLLTIDSLNKKSRWSQLSLAKSWKRLFLCSLIQLVSRLT